MFSYKEKKNKKGKKKKLGKKQYWLTRINLVLLGMVDRGKRVIFI